MEKQKVDQVQLSAAERKELEALLRKGKHAVRKVKRARVLLLAADRHSPKEIASLAAVSLATVYNVVNRFLAGSLRLEEGVRSGQPRKVTPRVEASITQLACSSPPEGQSRWTLRLLAEKVVELGHSISDESVRVVLKKSVKALAQAPVVYRKSGR